MPTARAPDLISGATAMAPGGSRDTRWLWAGLFMSLAVFAKVPQLDIWVSEHYWREGSGFFAAQTPWVQALYRYTPPVGHSLLVLAALILLVAPGLARVLQRRPPERDGTQRLAARLRFMRRTALAGLLVGVISSGLLVELTFKGWVGRPRPVQTTHFGGSVPFQGVFERGIDPKRHKSFTSGHAAAGFSLMALGLCASPIWRRRWFVIGLATGGAVGLGRIIQGGHYLSDVVFSFYIVWLTCELVAYGFWRYDLSRLAPHHPLRKGPRSALR